MDKNELDKIGEFTRRKFAESELYTFPVKLCDNDIDRDGEAFTGEALEKLAELFVGRTGIFDHDPKGSNQTARIYETEIVTDPEKLTAYGEPYKFLRGKAYTVRTEDNKSLIAEIDAGIKKEVSISCSAGKRTCSVCGCDVSRDICEHMKGTEYDGKLCYHKLDNITDAYEWSFVAVPAQINAGVTKKFDKEEKKMNKFEPVTTREALDEIVNASVAEAVKKFEGYISPEEHAKALESAAAAQRSAELKCMKLNAAVRVGLPAALADKIAGEDEEAINKDAELLASLTVKATHQPRHFDPEGSTLDGVEKAFYERNPDLKH